MSLLKLVFRASTEPDYLNDPNYWSVGGSLGTQTTSGERVSPESALALSVYFACLRNLAEDVAKIPFCIYRRLERGKERVTDHPVYRLIHDQPNPRMGAMSFRETLQHQAAGWGGGYAEIERDEAYRPIALWPIHASRVEVRRAGKSAYYRVRIDDTKLGFQYAQLPIEDVFHVHGVGPDGFQGYSVARNAAESLGAAIATQRYSSAFFGNGARAAGILKHPRALRQEARDNLRESWERMHGGAKNSHKVSILEEGMDFQALSIPPEEAQFIETREFQTEDIARWFRMPPSKIGHLKRAQGWSTLEMTNTDYVIDTLLSWTERWEQEVDRKLLSEAEQGELFSEHVFLGLLKGDSDKRATFYEKMVNLKVMTVNEVRELENMNPVAWGDEPNEKAAPAPAAPPASERTAEERVAELAPVFVETTRRVLVRRRHQAEESLKKAKAGKLPEDWIKGWCLDQFTQSVADFAPAFQVLGLDSTAPGIRSALGLSVEIWRDSLMRSGLPEDPAESTARMVMDAAIAELLCKEKRDEDREA